jgi:hypothetical protein
MSMSDYLENALLNAVLRNTPYTSPSQVYVALFTSDPTDAGTGTEVSGGGYTRQAVTFNAPLNGQVTNSTDILFPIATASWGTITHFGIYDAATGGNLLFHGVLQTSKTISTDDQLKIAAGALSVSIN